MRKAGSTRAWVALGFVLVAGGVLAAGCGGGSGGEAAVSSTAYKGHESDADIQAFVSVYPAVVGTRLDDCQTCHAGGEVDDGDDVAYLNPCSYCHLIAYPDPDVVAGAPSSYADTLNAYGRAYVDAGRNAEAVRAIHATDSDGDSHANGAEVDALRYPGDPTSMPGQAVAPIFTFESADLHALAQHTQFLLMNSHRQLFDDYAAYDGVKVRDVVAATGADLGAATGVTILAPDGYAKDFSLAEMDQPFPDGLYYAGLGPGDFADPNQGFVNYPPAAHLPPGLVDGGPIPGPQWMTIAHGRDGLLMDPAYLDPVSGKVNGEGPYRLIVPQSMPGSPDRGSKYSPTTYGDGWDYDDLKDHNAGLCVRAVVAIRVNPMPAGFEEFDWKNGGWALLTAGRLIVYGSGVPGN